MVDFFVYVDDTGLGAMHCRPAQGAAPPKSKGEGKGGGVIKSIQKQKGGNSSAGGKGKASGKGAVAAKPSIASKGGRKGAPVAAKAQGEERTPPPPPDKASRQRLLPKRVIGKVIRWRGTIGWVRPTDKIDHPEADKHKKGLFVHQVDVQKGQELWQGAQVNFFVYTDDHGLGAEHVMLTKDQPAPERLQQQQQQKNAKKVIKGGLKPTAKVLPAKNGKGAKTKGAGKGKAAPTEKLTMVEKMKKKRNKGKKGKGGDGEKGEKGEKIKGGPDLPRERVTVLPVTGEVLVWKGKFGWLSSSETIEHEKSSKHDGKIYVHEKDILAGGPLTEGQPVEFHVYADASGLGAEEVIAMSS